MVRRYYRQSNRNRYSRYDAGRAAALKHIEEARELSNELGGTDEDVKKYFFNLTEEELRPILIEYGNEYGSGVREYAVKTLPRWKSGQTKMSGLVAGRLFSLLPSMMPLEKKYELVKSLWEKKSPYSYKEYFIGNEIDHLSVCELVRKHFDEVVKAYKIPDKITNRFTWLAKNDVDLQQGLHNYFLQLNRELVTSATKDRIPQFLSQIQNNRNVNQRITQEIIVGGHKLKLVFTATDSGISSKDPLSLTTGNTGCLVVLGIAFLLVCLANV